MVSRLPLFLFRLFHDSGVNLYANGSASCPLSAGARVGFPHSCCLTPPTLLLPSLERCLISPFDPSLPSGMRGYLGQLVASLCLLSQTTSNLLMSYFWLTATGSADCQLTASKWHKQTTKCLVKISRQKDNNLQGVQRFLVCLWALLCFSLILYKYLFHEEEKVQKQ